MPRTNIPAIPYILSAEHTTANPTSLPPGPGPYGSAPIRVRGLCTVCERPLEILLPLRFVEAFDRAWAYAPRPDIAIVWSLNGSRDHPLSVQVRELLLNGICPDCFFHTNAESGWIPTATLTGDSA